MKTCKDFKPNRSCSNKTSEFSLHRSYSPRIFSIFQCNKKCHAFYKTALPVYLRHYLSKADPQLNYKMDTFFKTGTVLTRSLKIVKRLLFGKTRLASNNFLPARFNSCSTPQVLFKAPSDLP